MTKKKRRCLIALLLVLMILISTLLTVFIPIGRSDGSSKNGDEKYVRRILDGYTVDKVIDDLSLDGKLIESSENYIMIDAMEFDFTKQAGIADGTTYLYFNKESREIECVMHSYVSYTNNSDPKTELENTIGNIQGNITKLLGNPSQPFVLMNTSGEFEDYSGMSIDEMIAKLIEGQTVMYTMYESNGLRYELNLMYSDNTIYMMVWVYDESSVCTDENCEHNH